MKRITAILVLVFIMLLSTKIVFAEDSYWAILGIKLGAPAADVTSLLTNNFSNAQIYTIRQTITVGEFKSAPLTLGVNMLQENRIDFLRGPHVPLPDKEAIDVGYDLEQPQKIMYVSRRRVFTEKTYRTWPLRQRFSIGEYADNPNSRWLIWI